MKYTLTKWDVVFDILFISDIYVNFFTTYFDGNDELIVDKKVFYEFKNSKGLFFYSK